MAFRILALTELVGFSRYLDRWKSCAHCFAVPDIRIDGRAGESVVCGSLDFFEFQPKSSQKAAIASPLEVLRCLVDWRCGDMGHVHLRAK